MPRELEMVSQVLVCNPLNGNPSLWSRERLEEVDSYFILGKTRAVLTSKAWKVSPT